MKYPRKARLTTQADFRHVFAGSVATRDCCFRVLSRANQLDYCRLGMAVSRKACRSAAGRNRIKRLIRESFRQNLDTLSGNVGLDLVVLPTAKTATICNKDLFTSLQGHWKRTAERSAHNANTNNRIDR